MWNVYVVSEDGECERVNAALYDAEQVAMFLEAMDEQVASVLLLPTTSSPQAAHQPTELRLP